MRASEFTKQGVAEGKLDEIDFSSELGSLTISPKQMIADSPVDGTIGTRKVYLYTSGENKIYFFTDSKKIDALVYVFQNRIMGMKNFSANKGLVYNLFQYIINIKKQKVRLTSKDKLTPYGIKWIIDQIRRPNGFKITDARGNKIDPAVLYNEWENARLSDTSGPTEIVISESTNAKKIRENEARLMPMDIFGATLKKIDEQLLPRLNMNNILEQDMAESISNSFAWKNKNKIYSTLIDTVGSGPFDGGCVVFARALQLRYGGDIMVLDGYAQRGAKPAAQHAVLQLNGKLVDADGWGSPDEVIARFERNELQHAGGKITGIRPIAKDDLLEAPRDESVARQIAKLLQNRRMAKYGGGGVD